MSSDAVKHAGFSAIRYAQVWEDADLLVQALNPQPGDTCLSIASAGDNALALLARGARVIAVDSNPAQLACLALRVAAYRSLTYPELLEFMGSRRSQRRLLLYQRCRGALSEPVRAFWDKRKDAVAAGIGGAGRLERQFELFRERLLPLVHSRKRVDSLLRGGAPEACRRFYEEHWDTWRWRLLFKVLFSRFVMGRLGQDASIYRHGEGSVADRLLARTRYALTELDPADNPYLQWILTGTHGTALPFALREENFEAIRFNLDKLEWHTASIEEFLARTGNGVIDHFNLSDIFEHMSEADTGRLLARIVHAGRPGGRLAYWNLFTPRSRPASLAARLAPRQAQAAELFAHDKAFFYSAFVVEEILA